ncbi:MAG: putative amidoligase domain-containing protein, partial [Minisyncoccia bacterium]
GMRRLGADPEVMLADALGHYRSASPLLPHKSQAIMGGGCDFYFDTVLAECTVRPAAAADQFVENIGFSLKTLSDLVAPFKLQTTACWPYRPKELKHKFARMGGCKPEWCAYTLLDYRSPRVIRTPTRAAGGHIHIGSEILADDIAKIRVVRMLDLFYSLPCIYIDRDYTAYRRRRGFGQAGRHRRPAHGLEYRTPGPFWLRSPELVRLTFDLVKFAVDFVAHDRDTQYWTIDPNWHQYEDIALAHKCHGYDVERLREAIDLSSTLRADGLAHLVREPLGGLWDRVMALADKCFNLYEEWGL